MMIVRFDNGHTIQYNDAYFIRWGNSAGSPPMNMLYNKDPKKGGRLIAAVPLTAIIEWERPCRVYHALYENQLAALEKEVRSIKRKIAK